MSSVPHLLVNNTGSDATGTDVYPQPGAPLEVWCWTEKNESSSRLWHNSSGRVTQYENDTDATNEDVYVLKYPNMTHIKILTFRSYQHSQAGRYECNISLTEVDPHHHVSLSIFIGMKVIKAIVMIINCTLRCIISILNLRNSTQGGRCYCDGVW